MDTKKKILTSIVFVLFFIVFVLAYIVSQRYIIKNNFEREILPFASKNAKTIFNVNKIVFFSNCDAKNKFGSSSNFTLENLYQYTDIAIFINHSSPEEKTLENTFKKVSIHNVQYIMPPNIGEPKLFFKGLGQLGKSDLPTKENEIIDELNFLITSEDKANLDTPTLYNNSSNPITLSYINQNIKSDYTITNTSIPITYDGSLLKRCNISLDSITCKLSFDIDITNNLDQEFKSTVLLNIPLETPEKSILDGNIRYTQNCNFTFYRYK